MAPDLTPNKFKLKGLDKGLVNDSLKVQLILTKFAAIRAGEDEKYSFTNPKQTKFSGGSTNYEVTMGFITPTAYAKAVVATIKEGMTAVTVDGERIEFPEIGTDSFKFGFCNKILGWSIETYKAKKDKYRGFKECLVDKDGNRLQLEGKDAYDFYVETTTNALDNIFIHDDAIPFTGGSITINPTKFTYLPLGGTQSVDVGQLFKNENKRALENLNVSLEKARVTAFIDVSIAFGKSKDGVINVYTNFSIPSLAIKQESALTPAHEALNKDLGRIAQNRRESAKLIQLSQDDEENGFDLTPKSTQTSSLFS